jgi:serine/threonine-protein kinase
VVHLGHRTEGDFRQQVAVKVLRHPGRHPDLVRRFRMERQILADLQHPYIARILDGGVAEGGWPYLAMEYVEGEPITNYCARTGASLETRLELFRAVCEAVHHAHQRLVVHRDLKPSNILVTADGKVKLLDFGIAKLLDDDDVLATMTATGARLFTPDYAAPEQIRGNPITTSTDVYALGVLLYELLAGERPYRLGGRSLGEIERLVCDEDPVPPATAATRPVDDGDTSDRGPADPAARRFRHRLRGDLDTICLKALRKEPSQRYASAHEFAVDLERYTEGLPVKARPATRAYRFERFVRRNRIAAAGTTALVLLSLLFAGYSTVQESRMARARAESQLEAERANEITDLLLGMFEAADPQRDRADTLSVTELLERGVERAAGLDAQPRVQAEIWSVMGRAYRGLGDYERSAELLRRSVERHEDLGIPDRESYVGSLERLGRTLALQRRHDEALQLQGRVLDARREMLGDDHPHTAIALARLAQTHLEAQHYDRAESLSTIALERLRRRPPENPEQVLDAESNLAVLHAQRGDFATAAAIAESVLVHRRALLGDDHVRVARDLHNLAGYTRRLADYDRAERLFRQALAIRRAQLPPTHPWLASTLHNLAIVVDELERHDEAEELYLEALDVRRRAFGDAHPRVASSYANLGVSMSRRGDHDRAIEYLEQGVETLRRAVEPPDASLASALRNLAATYYLAGRLDEARLAADEALEQTTALVGERSTRVGYVQNVRAAIALADGDADEAERLRREAGRIFTEALGEDHPRVAAALHGLGAALAAQDRTTEADSAFARAVRIRRAALGDEHRLTRQSIEALEELRSP